MFELDGKVALITGGAGVLGSAIAEGLARAGAKVALLGRTKATVDRKVKEINYEGGTALALVADVLDAKQLEKAKKKLVKKWDQLDILINCAGGNMKGATVMPDQDFFDLDMEDFDKVADLNLQGTVLPCKIMGSIMADQKKGCIINISSMAADRAITRVVGYSAAKAGIDNFTKWLAVEMAHKYGEGIRINAIAPGFYLAEQNRHLLMNDDGSYTDRGQTIIKSTPMKRLGKPEELISTVLWLCSEGSSFITGIVVPVDGGFSAFSGV